MSDRQFRNLGLYTEHFRGIGTAYCMGTILAGPRPIVVAIGVHRDRSDFSERDRLLLNTLRPHIVRGYDNACAVTRFVNDSATITTFSEAWIRHEQRTVRGELPPARTVLTVKPDGKRLSIQFFHDGARAVLLLEEHDGQAAPDVGRWGLTRREAEVVQRVAEGKTSIEICIIPAISPRTVGKHLERIYQKLGVETRTAAAHVILTSRSAGT